MRGFASSGDSHHTPHGRPWSLGWGLLRYRGRQPTEEERMHVDVKGTRFKVTTGDGQSLTVAGPLGIEELTAPRLIVGSDRYPIDPKIYPKLGGTRVYS